MAISKEKHRVYMREYMRRYRAADLARVQAERKLKGLPPLKKGTRA